MKSLLAHSGRFLLTGVMVALAGVLGWHLWDYYMDEPWTRDGKIRADVVRLAADVSGIVSEVDAKDNQAVRKGDVIFRIDQARLRSRCVRPKRRWKAARLHSIWQEAISSSIANWVRVR